MLTLLTLPNYKLDLHLREKRLDPLVPKILFRIKTQAIRLIALLMEHLPQPLTGKRACGRPSRYATIGVRCGGEFERRAARGRGGVEEGQYNGDRGPGAPDGSVEDVACDWGFLLCRHCRLIYGCRGCSCKVGGER